MAQSIFTTLATRRTLTTVPFLGKDDEGKTIRVEHTIPDELFPTDTEFESPEKLETWARETGWLFPMLQMGVEKALIEARAKFKAPKKGKDNQPDEWTPEMGQTNIDNMEWTPTKRPGQSNNAKAIAEASLKATVQTMQNMVDVANMTKEQLLPVLENQFNGQADIVEAIISQITF